MDNQIKLMLGIFVAGIIVSILIGFNSTGFVVQGENVLTRDLPSSVGVGDIFYVKYAPAETDASLDVQIKDSVSGGCEFVNSGKTFEKIIVYAENAGTRGIFEVRALEVGSCKFEGSYKVGDMTKSLPEKTVLVG